MARDVAEIVETHLEKLIEQHERRDVDLVTVSREGEKLNKSRWA